MSRPNPRQPAAPWAEAVAHQRREDPHFEALNERDGPCLLRPRLDRFATLVRAVIGQQISSNAAAAIDARLRALGGEPHQPSALLGLGEVKLRSAGISGVKARTILNLAETVVGGHVPLDEFDRWDDDAIVARLTTVKGIGVWTAEMFLIFALNRPDVLPAGDLGVRAAIRDRHGLPDLPRPHVCRELAEPWRPFRTIASWYLWKAANSRPGGAP